MNCREFEHKLWESPGKFKNRENLPAELADHLSACSECAAIYDDFIKMADFAVGSEIKLGSAKQQQFDEKVWQKIDAIQSGTKFPERAELLSRHNLGFGQLLASLGIAAATVTMLMLAISNITDQPQVSDLMGQYGKKAMRGSQDIVTQTVPRHYNVIFKRDKNGGFEIREFSLLSEPEVNVVDDSTRVSIEAAYLTDEGLDDEEVEVTRALSKELVIGTGVMDTSQPELESRLVEAPESDYVITVEKMPKMIKAVPPSYPAFAYKLKRGGEVWIKAHIDANGEVQQAMIHRDSGTNYGFEEAALTAAYKNKFEPFEVNGRALPVWVIYKVKFVAKD